MRGLSYIKFLSIFLLIYSNIIFCTDYYVSWSTGNDNNSGTTETAPWKSITKVNSNNFLPGDRVLFKRGDKWEGTPLLIKNSGTSSNRITFGAYDAGERPVITLKSSIPGWNIESNWTKVSGDSIWRMNFPSVTITSSKRITRMWFNGIEYAASKGDYIAGDNLDNLQGGSTSYGVNRLHRFLHYSNTNLYVWTNGTNPAKTYSNIEYSGVIRNDGSINWFTVSLAGADYITLEGLEIQGGMYSSIGMKGSDYFLMDNCHVGKYAKQVGFTANTDYVSSTDLTSDYGEIKNSIIDSDYKVKFHWHLGDEVLIAFGVVLSDGANYWKVHHNEVCRWANNLFVSSKLRPSLYNEFFNNDVHSEEGTYSKGGQVNAYDPYNHTYTKYYNNYFHDLTAGLNICGSSVQVFYNIFENIRYSTNEHATSSNSGYGLQLIIPDANPGTEVDSTIIYNNTFYGTYREAIFCTRKNTWIENNLFVNCSKIYTNNNLYIRSASVNRDNINNNMFHLSGASSNEKYYYWVPENVSYTITELNAIPDMNGDITKDNLEHLKPVNELVNISDYSLPSGSPAVNRGLERSWMRKTDFNGNPIIGLRDIGAIEYTGTLPSQNSAPTISSVPVASVSLGSTYVYDVDATGTPSPTYKLTTYPTGMAINSSTGIIQWIPSAAGNYNIIVEASNGITPNATQSFTISVSNTTSNSPVINSYPDKNATVGQIYNYDVNASGNPAPTYKLTEAPSNMIINSSTGIIQWTPASSGIFNVSVEASNGVHPVAVQSFTISVSENSTNVPAGAISYWKLDEKSGTTFKDEIGNNNASAISLPIAVTGIVGGAQKFNGSSSKLDVPANSSFDFGATQNFSVEFWYNGTVIPSTAKAAIGRYFPNGDRWWIGLNANDGKARFYMSGGTASAALTGEVITDGQWHHVAATRNGSNSELKLYVDGVLQSSIIKVFNVDFSSVSENLNIGWLNYQSAYTLSGNLDEIAFHKVELSASDVKDHYNNGIAGSGYFNTSVTSNYATVNTKIYLQGPYANGLMSTLLRSGSLLPLSQPYSCSPWNYTGSEKVTSIPSDVVDWVLVELRTGTALSTTLKKRAGFLKKDGSIVDLDGITKLKFDGVTPGNYYLVIKHRNHLDVMSSSPISISLSSPLYDFTNLSSKAYGAGSLVNLGNGVYGMISGDGDSNGLINILDYGMVLREINQTGYLQGDFDLNKIVDANDYEKSGSGLFNSSKVPQ